MTCGRRVWVAGRGRGQGALEAHAGTRTRTCGRIGHGGRTGPHQKREEDEDQAGGGMPATVAQAHHTAHRVERFAHEGVITIAHAPRRAVNDPDHHRGGEAGKHQRHPHLRPAGGGRVSHGRCPGRRAPTREVRLPAVHARACHEKEYMKPQALGMTTCGWAGSGRGGALSGRVSGPAARHVRASGHRAGEGRPAHGRRVRARCTASASGAARLGGHRDLQAVVEGGDCEDPARPAERRSHVDPANQQITAVSGAVGEQGCAQQVGLGVAQHAWGRRVCMRAGA